MYLPTSIPKGPQAKRGQGFPFPAQRFRQGPRIAYNLVLPMTALSQMVDVDKIGAADNEMNRELKKAHLQSCGLYFDAEPEYVLGGLVLAADATQVAFVAGNGLDDLNEHLRRFDELYLQACGTSDAAEREAKGIELTALNDEISVCSGTLWIPYGVRLEVTDGQHRIKTVIDRLKAGDRKLQHPSQGIPAMIMIEPRNQKRQQDFVDLGQTEAIKPTIKINMDYRQPVTKLIKELVDHVPVFEERFIEFRRASVRKSSGNLYSLSNLKTAVQAMLLGNTRLGVASAQRKLTEKLAGHAYDGIRDKVMDFFSRLSHEVDCFRRILEDPDAIDYPQFRAKYLCLNSVGLGVMGMVAHEVILGRISTDEAVRAVSLVDWSRDNLLWDGTLRVGSGIARGGNVIELGAAIVKAGAGLRLTQRDVERINSVEGLETKLPSGALNRLIIEPQDNVSGEDSAPVPSVAEEVATV